LLLPILYIHISAVGLHYIHALDVAWCMPLVFISPTFGHLSFSSLVICRCISHTSHVHNLLATLIVKYTNFPFINYLDKSFQH
jgi:hypothetical protein